MLPRASKSRFVHRCLHSPFKTVSLFYLVIFALAMTHILDVVGPGSVSRWSMAVSVILYWILTYIFIKTLLTLWSNWRLVAAIALGGLIALGISEVVVRAVDSASSFPAFTLRYSRRFHHMSPQSRVMYHGRDSDTDEMILVTTNRHGFRTPYSPEDFVQHNIRIVVLGDSFAFGYGVLERDAVPARLEETLRSRMNRKDIAVLNAGVVGYSPFLQRLLMQDILVAYRPTLVILLLDATDIGNDYEYARIVKHDRAGPYFERTALASVFGFDSSLIGHSALFRRVSVPVAVAWTFIRHPVAMGSSDINPMRVHGVTIDGIAEDNLFFIYRHSLDKTRDYFEFTKSQIDGIAAAAAGAGSGFVLAIGPRYHHWNAEECPYNWESYAYSNHEVFQFEYFRFFDEQQDQSEYEICSLLPAFINSSEGPLTFKADPHWNARGHGVAVNAIADVLLKGQLATTSARTSSSQQSE